MTTRESGVESAPAASEWVRLPRPSAHIDLAITPALTVIAAVPSWGVTDWMIQCEDHVRSSQGSSTLWATTRKAVRHILQGGVQADVVFIDDVPLTAGDELWDVIGAYAARNPGSHVIVRSLDCPPPLPVEEVAELTEKDLAFDAEEVRQLARLNAVTAPESLYATVSTMYGGNATLIRQRLSSLSSDEASWANPDARLDVHLADALVARLRSATPATRSGSVMLRVIEAAARMRWCSVDLLQEEMGLESDLHRHFDRLAQLPFGSTRLDDESGLVVFEWTDGVWEMIRRVNDPERHEAALRETARLAHATDHLALELHTLIEVNDIDAAERLAHDQLRYFLLALPDNTARAIGAIPWDDLRTRASLLLLAGERRMRVTGSAKDSAHYFEAALHALNGRTDITVFDRLRTMARKMFALASLGRRADATRTMKSVTELVLAEGDQSVAAAASRDLYVADRLAAEMYLPFWVATQLDDHLAALHFTSIMRAHESQRSRTAAAERNTALTQEVFLGYHEPDREALGTANTDAMILLERGLDDQALALIALLEERIRTSPSRSAAEAFVITLRSIVDPTSVQRGDVVAMVERSTALWTDGKPSSLVNAAAAYATLVAGDAAGALRMVRHRPRDDWFALVVEAVLMLALDRAEDAMNAVERAGRSCHAPRANAVTGVLAASAHARLGRREAAVRRLEHTAVSTSPGMLRMALRFITAEDFASLHQLRTHCGDVVAGVFEQAAGDSRHFHEARIVHLTPVDREVLVLLREGCTNAEIAQRRFVSMNTVRTQIRLLLRKLDAADRHAAVLIAEQMGVFDAA